MDDHRAIEALLMTYADRIDAGDFAGVGALFEHGRIVVDDSDRTTDVVGDAAVEAMYTATTRRYDDGTPRTQHVTSNVVVTVDGHRARSSARFTVLQATPELALQPIITGRYDDTFVNIDGSWWFDERRMTVGFIGDVSHHLLIDLG